MTSTTMLLELPGYGFPHGTILAYTTRDTYGDPHRSLRSALATLEVDRIDLDDAEHLDVLRNHGVEVIDTPSHARP